MRFSEGRPVLPWSQSQGPWFGNPFEEAPIHLSRILDPELNEVGIDQIAGWLCIDTDHWQQSWAQAPQVFTYPADGTKGWKNETTAGETPTTPEEILGLPVFHSTVRFYAFTGGTGGTMIKPSSASLRGPEGDVPVRWINRNDDVSIPADAVIFVPTKSLQPGATYTASVTVATSKGPLSKSWSFTLGGSASGEKTPTIRPIKGSFSLGWLRSAGSRFKILTSGGGQIRLTVTTKRIGGSVVARFTTAKTDQWHSVSVPARQVFHGVPKLGRYEVTITGPGCKTASGVVTVSP
jgi:hypothetical protein